ncbi:MAG: 5-dehydro-4-deoxyglucarate dehydratase [Chloroflexi bacterium]|nr:5-dehydro-4-deoxyglucarate dehydratase [Chloroflexota bacterium]
MPMSLAEVRERLRGVLTFPVTPFHADFSVDYDGLRHIVRRMLRAPIHAVVAAGGTGELYSLTPDEHAAVVRAVVEEVGGRVPVVAGVGYNLMIGLAQARAAAAAGADCLLLLPPYYPNADPAGLHAYYAAICNSVPLPSMVYNRDWVVMTPPQVQRLADSIPNLIAFKDGQGDVRNFKRIKRAVGDRLLWLAGVGDDMVDDYFAAGAEGYTSSLSNLDSQLSVDLYELASQHRRAELHALMVTKVYPLYELRGKRKGYEVSTIKTALNLMGLPGGPVRPPLVELTGEERQEQAAILASVGLLQLASAD